MEVQDFKIEVSSVSEMRSSEADLMIKKFNLYGCVLIDQAISENSRGELLKLSYFFGRIIIHDLSDEDGIVVIQAGRNNPSYVNTTFEQLALHTDGSFEINPPKVVAMQCKNPAVQGGLTTLMQAQYIYDFLLREHSDVLPTLFISDCFTIKRDKKEASHPVFQHRENRIFTVFRSDNVANVKVKSESLYGFRLIQKIIGNLDLCIKLQIESNQILVCDNTRILHGRTAFSASDHRSLNRLWFDGRSSSNYSLLFGF